MMFGKAVAVTLMLAAVPAAAGTSFTVNFAGPTLVAPSISTGLIGAGSQGSINFFATSVRFSDAPGGLTSLSQTSPLLTTIRTGSGLGVGGGGANNQIDTNDPTRREGLLLSASNFYSIHSVTLTNVDANDTFQLYGVSGQNLINLGYGAFLTGPAAQVPGNPTTISGGLTNDPNILSVSYNPLVGGGTATIDLADTALYNAYLFTTRVSGNTNFGADLGQGYSLLSLAGALPEPGTWLMMVSGFGLVGVSLRRRRPVAAA